MQNRNLIQQIEEQRTYFDQHYASVEDVIKEVENENQTLYNEIRALRQQLKTQASTEQHNVQKM